MFFIRWPELVAELVLEKFYPSAVLFFHFNTLLLLSDLIEVNIGASFLVNDGIKYRLGRWGKDMNNSSSNYRELRNLVEALEEMQEDGFLKGAEVFMFTDNTVAESAFYKCTH